METARSANELEALLAMLDLDRTRHTRVDQPLNVDCLIAGRKVSGKIKNISVKGIRAVFDRALPSGAPFLLRIWFPDTPETGEEAKFLDSYAEIVWTIDNSDREYGMAFVTMETVDQEWLACYVERHGGESQETGATSVGALDKAV